MTTTKPTVDRGAAYLRVSSDKQDARMQRDAIQEWLDRHGLTVSRWYDDIGSRHTAYKRPDFNRMMATVNAPSAGPRHAHDLSACTMLESPVTRPVAPGHSVAGGVPSALKPRVDSGTRKTPC